MLGKDSPPPSRPWWSALKQTVGTYRNRNLADWAAALTYYAVLSLFPALLAVVSVLGLLGSSALDSLIDEVGRIAPAAIRETLTTALENLRGRQAAAGLALVLSLLLALWSASGYVAGFMRASNAVYEVEEGRPLWKFLPLRVGLTLGLLALLTVGATGVVFTGTLADQAGDALGLGDAAVRIWEIAKWPVLVVLVSVMIALLYWAAPNIRHQEHPRHSGFRWVSPGSLLAVLLWIAASLAFAFYVANFGSYNQTYGSLAAAIIFLIWLYLSNSAILLGLAFNAERDQVRAVPTEPRDTRAMPEDGENRS